VGRELCEMKKIQDILSMMEVNFANQLSILPTFFFAKKALPQILSTVRCPCYEIETKKILLKL